MSLHFLFYFNESGEIILDSHTQNSVPVTPERKRQKECSLNPLAEDVSNFLKNHKPHNNILGATGDIFKKVADDKQLAFKLDVLHYVHIIFKSLSGNT